MNKQDLEFKDITKLKNMVLKDFTLFSDFPNKSFTVKITDDNEPIDLLVTFFQV